jgi:hypothetical protein
MGQEFAPRPRKWTVEEGAKLTSTVQEYGDSNSAAVAALVPGRMDKQCRTRWIRNWTPP